MRAPLPDPGRGPPPAYGIRPPVTAAIPVNGFRMGPDTPLKHGSGAWERELPAGRDARGGTPGSGLSYGDYFTAIATLLSCNGFALLTDLLARHLDRAAVAVELTAVNIYLEKHGEFYHPARIEARLADGPVSLVLNGAISMAGRATAKREFDLLKTLRQVNPESGIPRVYWLGELPVAGEDPPVAFVGEWFGGYHEFHWSRDPVDRRIRLTVWDPETGPRYLSDRLVPYLYSSAAEILTGLYDARAFTQVFPWHHAAGDFVVRDTAGPLDVRLITVRNHIAFLGTEGPPDEDTIFQALLLFFLVTGIRMRLDRLDGVGAPVWAPSVVVEATTRGFFRALGRRRDLGAITANNFLDRLSVWSATDLFDIADPLTDLIALGADEAPKWR
jgi:hypothetical protein